MKGIGQRILIILEIVALIVVIVLGAVMGIKKVISGKDRSIEVESNKENDKTVATTDVYEEGRISFDDDIEQKLNSMTVEEKVAQMLLVSPEKLANTNGVKVAGDATKAAINATPIAGVVVGKNNLLGQPTTPQSINNLKKYGVDRVGFTTLAVVNQQDAASSDLVAPEAMMLTGLNSIMLNPIVEGSSAEDIQSKIAGQVKSYSDVKILPIIPFVPDQVVKNGGDSALKNYKSGYAKGMLGTNSAMMISNEACEGISENEILSLSATSTKTIRSEMGYEGILITSDMNSINGMSQGEAGVAAVNAGMNILYYTSDYNEAYQAIIAAVKDGTIKQTLIDNAVGRILKAKKEIV